MTILTTLGDLFRGKTILGGVKRSPKWSAARAKHIKLFPRCACCGGTVKLEVHHKKPFHLYPELELDPNNFITLCEAGTNGINCHLLIGHLGNYKSLNINVDQDSVIWNNKILTRPSSDNTAA